MTCATIPSPVLRTQTHTHYKCIVANIAVNTWHTLKGRCKKTKQQPYLLTSMVWHPDSLIDTELSEKRSVHATFSFPGWAGNLTRPEEDVWPGVSVAAEGYRVEGLRDPADHPGTGPGNLRHRMQCEWACSYYSGEHMDCFTSSKYVVTHICLHSHIVGLSFWGQTTTTPYCKSLNSRVKPWFKVRFR